MAHEDEDRRKAREAWRFYHVTTRERLASIAEGGFDPSHSRTGNGMLYLSPTMHHALAYAGHHGGPEAAVLLRIEGRNLDPAAMGPDDVDLPDLVGDAWDTHDWLDSVRASEQCTYDGVVPASLVLAVPCPDGVPQGDWLPVADLAAELATPTP